MASDSTAHRQGQEDKDAPAISTHRFAKWNPFREDDDEGGEELGEELGADTVAGGGRGTFGGDIEERRKLPVSHALRKFLEKKGEIKEADVGEKGDNVTEHSAAVQSILIRQPTLPIDGPGGPNDRSHPLPAYLISSSHNSYLVGGQLRGKTSAERYHQILSSGVRCVEIDAWDGDDNVEEPKVTHGMTLVEHITFRSACEAIGKAMDLEIAEHASKGLPPPLPAFISLENHCGHQGQRRLAAILQEVLGDKLVSQSLHADGTEATLKDFEGKVLVMVEYYGQSAKSDATEDPGKNAKEQPKIVPELAALGPYAQSIKPSDDRWLKGEVTEDPKNPLLNIGEGPLLDILEKTPDPVAKHNAAALMRVYPAGTRIFSKNLNPVPFWGVGAQVAALNCQTFDMAMQLQEALFDGTYGWVLKPSYLRKEGGPSPSGTTRLTMEVVGATDLPIPKGREADDIKPYVTCTLYHPGGGKPSKQKTSHYRQHGKGISSMLHKHEYPAPNSPIWHEPETLTWEYPSDDLVFLRILIKSDDSFAKNPVFACSAVRVAYLQQSQGQYVFLRLFNLRGEKTRGTLMVKFNVEQKA